MAGTISNGAVFWNVGDTSGRNDAGAATALPVGPMVIGSGSATPSAAPTGGAPIYEDTDTEQIYVWQGTAWIGPYSTS